MGRRLGGGPSKPLGWLKASLSSLLGDCCGQGLVEYLLALGMVALGSVVAEQVFACRLSCALELTGYQFERIIDRDVKKIPPGQLKKCSKKCD
jgi:hypothetical protein